MNIFVLDRDPRIAAKQQCDRHVVKMILESAQMLSTAHRVLDGEVEVRKSKSGKTTVKYWRLPDKREQLLYNAVHVNHPCTVWCRAGDENYKWLYDHFIHLCEEYKLRYNRTHKTETLLREALQQCPSNISRKQLTSFALAMPEEYKTSCPVESYHRYYKSKQTQFKMVWTQACVPPWFFR